MLKFEMGVLELLYFIVFLGFVTSEQGSTPFIKSCRPDDMICLRNSTQQFFEKTYKGIPEFDILPIDPLVIPDSYYLLDDIKVSFMNITITGLKDQDISEFRMDTNYNNVFLSLNAKVDITSQMLVTSQSQNPTTVCTGRFSAKADVLGNTSYHFELKPGGKENVAHFIVGPERIVGQVKGEPKFDAICEEIDTDIGIQIEERKANRVEFIKKLVEKAYVPLIHNIRAAAKVFPAETFFILP